MRNSYPNEDKEMYERIISTVPGVLYDYILYPDGTSQFLYVSPQSADILEIDNQTLINDINKFFEIIHPEDVGIFCATDMKANKEGKFFGVEIRIITPSGKHKWIQLTSLPNPTRPGHLTVWSGVMLDITKQKKLEEELKHAQNNLEKEVKNRTLEIERAYKALKVSEEKYRDLIENANSMIIKLDTNGNIQFFNEFAEKFFGFNKDKIMGKNIMDTIVPQIESSGKNLHELMGKIIKNPKKYPSIINENITKSGKTVWVSWTNKGIYTDNGDLVGIQCIGIDTTLRKKIENEREQLIKELKRSNRELQSFAYITSHDLQEPLRTIASYAQLIEKRYKGQLDKDADDFLEYMITASKRMKDMINGLLNYSRLNTEEKELKEIDMNKVLENSLHNLKFSFEDTKAVITSDILPTLFVNNEMMVLVFQNLISNAIKFRKPQEPPKIHISALLDYENSKYIFKISDNGIGMEQQYTPQIFEVFKRLHPIGEYEGVGIGLSICRRVIEEYGGNIWVESELNKGSTFYFTIPSYNLTCQKN